MIVIVEVINHGKTCFWNAYYLACIAVFITYLASPSLVATANVSHIVVKNLGITFANMFIKQMCILLSSDNEHITQQW